MAYDGSAYENEVAPSSSSAAPSTPLPMHHPSTPAAASSSSQSCMIIDSPASSSSAVAPTIIRPYDPVLGTMTTAYWVKDCGGDDEEKQFMKEIEESREKSLRKIDMLLRQLLTR